MVSPYYPSPGTETVVNERGYYKGWFQSTCPGTGKWFDFVVAENWSVTSCYRHPTLGVHGGCSVCIMVLVEVVYTGAPLISPIANAGGPYIGISGNHLTFDGSGSTNGDGTIVLYEWDFGDGDTDTGEIVSHSYAIPNIYTVTLTVTDDNTSTDIDTTTATITLAPVPDTFELGFKHKKLWRLEV